MGGILYRFLDVDEVAALGLKSVGQNVLIHNSANLVSPATLALGDNVRIDPFVTITGDVTLGSYVHIGAYAYLTGSGGIEIADFAGLSQGVKIYSASDDYSGERMTNPMVPAELLGVIRAPVKIGRHAIVGANSVVMPGVTIGEGAAVGALSLVKTDLAPWGVYAGAPVRRIKDRSQNLLRLERELLVG